MPRPNQEFQTVRSEGGLLPPDLLRRLLDRHSSLAGTRPEDYGLSPGERLNEVITHSWNRLCRHYGEFRASAANVPEGEAGTGSELRPVFPDYGAVARERVAGAEELRAFGGIGRMCPPIPGNDDARSSSETPSSRWDRQGGRAAIYGRYCSSAISGMHL